MEIYFETDYKKIEYDAINHILVATWKLAPSSGEYREGMIAMIKAMGYFKAGRVVYDVIHLGAVLEEDQAWTATEWRDLAIAVGHSQVAFVLPDNLFTNISMEEMMGKADKDVLFAYFSRMEDAIRWVVISLQRDESKTNNSQKLNSDLG